MQGLAPRAEDIQNGKDFGHWAQATIGVPYATVNDIKALNASAKRLFEEHPGTNWQTLVRVARWMQSKHRRAARVHEIVNQFRHAYAAGAIDIEPIKDAALEEAFRNALESESDPSWRARLLNASGSLGRRAVVDEWKVHHSQTCTP